MNDKKIEIYEKIKDIFIEEAETPLDMKKGKSINNTGRSFSVCGNAHKRACRIEMKRGDHDGK